MHKAIKAALFLSTVCLACDDVARSIGTPNDNVGAEGGDGGTGGGDGDGDCTPMTAVDDDPDNVEIVGAAFLSDGLCPWQFDTAPKLTLQFSGGARVCTSLLWSELYDCGDAPTWFAELYLPFDEVGVYDLSENPGERSYNLIDADGGGGGGGGAADMGIIELTKVDETGVEGVISGFPLGNLNSDWFDLNGPFEATRCAPEQWLDVAQFDPNDGPEPGFHPDCTLPPPTGN